jgi:hypothetical protein
MANDVLLLGPFEFDDFAVPQEMPFGGAQRLAVHKLIGGQRVVDVLGADPADRKWSGIYWGADAQSLAMQLDAMRVAGSPLALSWGMEARTVVISAFNVQVLKFNYMKYTIKCTIADNNEASSATTTSADTLVNSDISAAQSTSVASNWPARFGGPN